MKHISKLLLFFLLFAVAFQYCQTGAETEKERSYVVMLSMDGFRWDYADMATTPNLDYITSHGVKAEALIPSFPTKTFPNHYSMATGLYPDHHGIVLNNFYDPETERTYAISDRDAVGDGTFYGGEPIWVTAEKQNVKSASCFWVGSEADIQGIRPSYWKVYQHDLPFEQRIDTVIYWLSMEEAKRPHLITFYFHEPDAIGHTYGPESQEIRDAVVYLDSLVGVLIHKLQKLPIFDQINLIVTSDHGMENISSDRVIFLGDYLKDDWIFTYNGGNPNYCIKVADGYIDTVYDVLKGIDHITVWKPGEVPERLHYGANPRVNDLIVVADSSWSVRWEENGRQYDYGGTHGYDNDNTDMHTIFYAMGPAFNENMIFPKFENIQIYSLIAHLLELEPAGTDGNFDVVKGMLKESH